MQDEKTILFIEKARKVHGDLFDYSACAYKLSSTKVEISCRVHGPFMQVPYSHLMGKGCKKCATLAHTQKQKKDSADRFVEKAKAVHGDRYEYSTTVYDGHKRPVHIVCSRHGVFTQSPTNHLSGNGCPDCGLERRGRERTSRAAGRFVMQATEVHEGRYDYSNAIYTGSLDKIVIRCSAHGDFWQIPTDHLAGRGCPACWAGRDQPTKLYILTNGDEVKIGVTANIMRRMKQHSSGGQPFASSLFREWELPTFALAYEIEQKAHKELNRHNSGYRGFDGAREWFRITPERAADTIENLLEGLQLSMV